MLGIVIPAYKRKDCLRQALQSLCYQTYRKFFFILVDDHSPEPLKDVVEEFDNRLHIIYRYAEENGGPGVARQIGLNLCYEKNFDSCAAYSGVCSWRVLYQEAFVRGKGRQL